MNGIIAYEFGPHSHEECVEDVQLGLVVQGQLGAVESAPKFHGFRVLPSIVQLFRRTFESLARFQSIASFICLDHIFP